MKRFVVDVYEVEIPPTDFRRDDLTEATEDELNRDRDYRFQMQGDNLVEIGRKLLERGGRLSSLSTPGTSGTHGNL